ncbi:lysophospholipid acyltransferase family protein [Congregibacter variabilis]|uniref:Lysophospholipid acyltransferase family protein n=1 Tax=Congregibacter variabilis TaxID=3081200 RepID=A0ABZ0I0Y3_9GAMM|nr:lysophospholipid acyltransferase family protein [Congregibacter sp. IMCC43200]
MKLLLGLLAAMPLRVSYAAAAVMYLLLYHLFRYRRGTVRDNLSWAFPQKSEAERKQIEKASYRHLCNLFMEILSSTRLPQAEMADRVSFTNPEVLAGVTNNFDKQAIVLLIHQGNWEWILHAAMFKMGISVDPVYKTLHSPLWNQYMLDARSRFGASPMPIDRVGREVIGGRKRKRLIAMLADQAGPKAAGYWRQFLNRPASFYRGADKLAQALDIPVVFAKCRRVETGRYEVLFEEISLPPHPADPQRILELYVLAAEAAIAEQPETYLWTNRRWKKTPPESFFAEQKTATTVTEADSVTREINP